MAKIMVMAINYRHYISYNRHIYNILNELYFKGCKKVMTDLLIHLLV